MSTMHERGAWPLEPDVDTVGAWIDEARDLCLEHLRTLAEQPASGACVSRAEIEALCEPLPEEPGDAIALLRRVAREIVPRSFHCSSPGYLAYVPGGGIVPAAIADLIADVTNRFVGVFAAAPLCARLEITATRWMLDVMGYPQGARGVLTSGGSIATLVALATARHARLGERFADGVVYTSDQAHHSVQKAARFVGFASDRVRVLVSADDLRFDPAELERAVAADRAAGLRPAIVVASAGTTSTGVVDDLDALAALCAREGLWLHVDAAYGGFFRMTARGRARLEGIERADSITVDPHKGLFLPYGTGCLLVRDGAALAALHRSETGYLPPLLDDGLALDFCEISPELSRDFRGLRVWLPLKIFGARAFREALDEKLDLAAEAARALAATPGFELVGEPDLSLVAFRWVGDGTLDPDGLERANRMLLERVLAHGAVWLSGAVVRKRFTQRICVLSFRTHREHVERAVELYRREAERLEL